MSCDTLPTFIRVAASISIVSLFAFILEACGFGSKKWKIRANVNIAQCSQNVRIVACYETSKFSSDGALTQTWEDTETKDSLTGLPGDNDPIDAIEIGEKIHDLGAVVEASVLLS